MIVQDAFRWVQSIYALYRGKRPYNNRTVSALDEAGLSFADHVEAVDAGHEWLRAKRRNAPKSFPRSPKSGSAQALPLRDYNDYVENFIDWVVEIGEAKEQSSRELMALARIFEAWSGWRQAQENLLIRALTDAGVQSRRLQLQRNDPRYHSAMQEKIEAKPYIILYQLDLTAAQQRQDRAAA